MKRFLLAVIGLVLILGGAALAAVGGLALSVFGTEGSYSAPGSTITSADGSLALVVDLAGVDVDFPYQDQVGVVTLGVSSTNGGPLFLGAAPQASVDQYLFGAPYDLATKSATWSTIPVPGVTNTLPLPQEQTFWTTSDLGDSPAIAVDSSQVPQTLVIMNADATPGVSVNVVLSFTSDEIFPYSVAAIAAGAVMILLGFALIVGAWLRRRSKKSRAAVKDGEVVYLAESTRTNPTIPPVSTDVLVDQSSGDANASQPPSTTH